MQDDNRGLGQGVTDNVPTPESFVVLVEKWSGVKTKNDQKLSYPSLAGHMLSWEVLHPVRAMIAKTPVAGGTSLRPEHRVIGATPCDVFLLNLRSIHDLHQTLPTEEAALLLHRVGYECNLDSVSKFHPTCSLDRNDDVSVTSYFSPKNICETSLTLQHECTALDAGSNLKLKSMQIYSYKLKLRWPEKKLNLVH